MSRITNIITRVRDTLADPSGDRWSDERLLRLVDEAQKDIARHSNILKGSSLIEAFTNTPILTLPDDLISVSRLSFNGDVLKAISYTEMDTKYDNWEEKVGRPTHFVFDRLNRKEVRLYPIPDTVYEDTDVLLDNIFGVVTGVEGKVGTFTSIYGVSSSIGALSGYVKALYIKQPITIIDVTDDLEVSDIFDRAIKYYVVGKALRDDMDTQNRIVGNEELSLYDRELKEAVLDSSMDFTSNRTIFETNYLGGI